MAWIFTAFVAVSIILFVLILRTSSRPSTAGEKTKPDGETKKKKPCPVCGSLLSAGEKVTSHEYRGKESSIVHIFGCPFCYGPTASLVRVCPVCNKEMGKEDYLAGTMVRGEKKIQMKVKGCSLCVGK